MSLLSHSRVSPGTAAEARVAVVIPCHDEAGHIAQVVTEVRAALPRS